MQTTQSSSKDCKPLTVDLNIFIVPTANPDLVSAEPIEDPLLMLLRSPERWGELWESFVYD
jgi:hypothetical protein